jgi:hypothetical protein
VYGFVRRQFAAAFERAFWFGRMSRRQGIAAFEDHKPIDSLPAPFLANTYKIIIGLSLPSRPN